MHATANAHIEPNTVDIPIDTNQCLEVITTKVTKQREIKDISEKNVPYSSNIALQNT